MKRRSMLKNIPASFFFAAAAIILWIVAGELHVIGKIASRLPR